MTDLPDDDSTMTDLPDDAVAEAERLTRLARDAVDENEAAAYRERRDDHLDEHGFVARVREDDGGDTLVCHPADWLDDEGVVRTEWIEDTERAAEVSLAGPGEQGDYERAAARNDDLVAAVRDEYEDVHAANARAFANFMDNHYARPMDDADARELREFLTEYYPRNAWPSEAQQDVVEESLRRVFAVAESEVPEPIERWSQADDAGHRSRTETPGSRDE